MPRKPVKPPLTPAASSPAGPAARPSSARTGRPDIDAFETFMEHEGEGGRQRGFFVSFGYTKDAEQECAAFY